MKRLVLGLFILTVLVVVCVRPVMAQSSDTVKGTCSIEMWDKYLGGSSPTVIDNDPSLQPSCTLFISDYYVGVWAAFDVADLGDLKNGTGHETDYYVGKNWHFGDGWFANIQATLWDMPPQGNFDQDVVEFKVRGKKTFNVWGSPAIYAKIVSPMNVSDPRAEFDATVGAEGSILLGGDWTFNPFVETIFDHGTDEDQTGFYGQTGANVAWKIGETVTLRPVNLRVIMPIGDWHGKKTEYAVGTGIDFNF